MSPWQALVLSWQDSACPCSFAPWIISVCVGRHPRFWAWVASSVSPSLNGQAWHGFMVGARFFILSIMSQTTVASVV